MSMIAKDVEDGAKLAKQMADEVLFETGLTISIGVANNKIAAKLGPEYSPKGSKYKLPGTITAIPPERYEEMCYGLDVEELLGVGRKMGQKLKNHCIYTIGDLAKADPAYIASRFGKIGQILQIRARGLDASPVTPGMTHASEVKSFGNSTTTQFDLCTNEQGHPLFRENRQ